MREGYGHRWYLAMTVASALAGPAFGGCTLPAAPSKVPDAASATDEQMRAAITALQAGDTDGASRSLQSAQAAIETIERAIGK